MGRSSLGGPLSCYVGCCSGCSFSGCGRILVILCSRGCGCGGCWSLLIVLVVAIVVVVVVRA